MHFVKMFEDTGRYAFQVNEDGREMIVHFVSTCYLQRQLINKVIEATKSPRLHIYEHLNSHDKIRLLACRTCAPIAFTGFLPGALPLDMAIRATSLGIVVVVAAMLKEDINFVRGGKIFGLWTLGVLLWGIFVPVRGILRHR